LGKESPSLRNAFAAAITLALQFVVQDSMAADFLAQARQFSAPARNYPELKQVSEPFDALVTRMEASTNRLKGYRKARVRATDRRYSSLTREFNQSRSRLSELERKLGKAPSLDTSRFALPTVSDRGSNSADVRERALGAEIRKYEQARASLRLALKALSNHYDQQLREIARLR
jgi:hypothetical protein